jgi:hypothetical protein
VSVREIAAFAVDKLSGSAKLDGSAVSARLEGTASQRDIDALEDFLAALLLAAQGAHAKRVAVDLRDVAYMNSSHFKVLVAWLGRAGKCEPKIAVTLRGNPSYHWQKRSLDALKHLAESWVTIES